MAVVAITIRLRRLHPVLREQEPGRGPGEGDLVVEEEPAGDLLGIAEIDGGAGRSCRPEGKARELQAGRGLLALF